MEPKVRHEGEGSMEPNVMLSDFHVRMTAPTTRKERRETPPVIWFSISFRYGENPLATLNECRFDFEKKAMTLPGAKFKLVSLPDRMVMVIEDALVLAQEAEWGILGGRPILIPYDSLPLSRPVEPFVFKPKAATRERRSEPGKEGDR